MTVTSNRKGSKFQRDILAYLRDELGGHLVVPQAGEPHDRGDIAGIPGWTLELKNYADTTRAIREGLHELIFEQSNAGTDWGAVVVKRRGVTDPAQQLVTFEMRQLVRLMRETANW